MSNRNKIIKNINKTKDYYKKMTKNISVEELADLQDTTKEITRKRYKIRPLKYKMIEREIDSEFFRLIFPAATQILLNGENFNKIARCVYFKEVDRHRKLFILSLRAKDYAMKYIIDLKEELFPAPEEVEKYRDDIFSLNAQ